MAEKKRMIQGVKGMDDALPEDTAYFQYIERIAADILKQYGYSEIRTPILESTDLFQRSVGDSSDIIVSKQMYTFTDPGDRSNTMRPEGTAGVVRSVIEHGMLKEQPTQKLWYAGPMFRYEKPQKGRLRQFNQIGFESLGYTHPSADAEVIAIVHRILSQIGFSNIVAKLNNLGDKEDRAKYNNLLREELQKQITTHPWCPQCKERALLNPMRIFDCKVEGCKSLAKQLPRIKDCLSESAQTHFSMVTGILDACGITWEIDEDLVRGLDYYCRTVFELVQTGTGAQSAVGGGGRYDGLVAELGGPDVCGVGVGLGVERLILAMKAQNISLPSEPHPTYYMIALDESSVAGIFALSEKAKNKNIPVIFATQIRTMKSGLKAAAKSNALFALMIGSHELTSGKALIKNLTDSSQQEIPIDELFV